MAIKMTDVMKNPGLLDSLEQDGDECVHCKVLLQETITGRRKTPDGDACSDCYFEKLGEFVASEPITSGGTRKR